jgi:hypothetical protein
MKLAEQHLPNGMAAQNDFCEAITHLIQSQRLKKIIETGSYLGEGTTQAIADALVGDEQVYSIEVNPKFHTQASKLHRNTPINFLLGLSIARTELPISTTFDVPEHVYIDHTDKTRAVLYKQEVSYPVADNMLHYALSKVNFMPDLVILDSAGHMGLQEFRYLMERVEPGFYLALDDTNHVKHYHTCELLGDNFKLIFSTDQGFGSRIYHIT